MDAGWSTEQHAQPHVLAVVLNWNGLDETMSCLSSLLASRWKRLTVVVVDNHSDHDPSAEISARFPTVQVIRNQTNQGFAGGMNTGLRHALDRAADYALLLNNDTVVDLDMIGFLVDAASRQDRVGIVSPLILRRDTGDVVFSAGLRCDLRRCYQGPPLGFGEADRGQFAGIREVDAVSGAAMLVPMEAVREVGMLDEGLFLYIEDVDWALRMRRVGRAVVVAGEARLWHGTSTSSGGEGSPRVSYYHTRNTFVVCARHLPMRGPRALLRHADILLSNLVSALRGRRRLVNARAVVRGWLDYLRGRSGAAPEVG